MNQLKSFVIEELFQKALPKRMVDNNTVYVNPTGRFVVSGASR